jgi:hypothetical protein
MGRVPANQMDLDADVVVYSISYQGYGLAMTPLEIGVMSVCSLATVRANALKFDLHYYSG